MAENKRVITTGKMGEPTPANIFPDFDWAERNRDRLRAEYVGPDKRQKLLLIYNEQVVGVGETMDEATRDAESRLAPNAPPITPITFTIGGFIPLIRLTRPITSAQDSE